MLELIEPSQAEPGCLKYELLQNPDDPTDFTFIETFANDEALKAHASAPYIARPRIKAERSCPATGRSVSLPRHRRRLRSGQPLTRSATSAEQAAWGVGTPRAVGAS